LTDELKVDLIFIGLEYIQVASSIIETRLRDNTLEVSTMQQGRQEVPGV